jgi:ComF family protein
MWQPLIRAGQFLASGLLDLLYPPACFACGKPPSTAADRGPFCGPCRAALTTDPLPSCPRCAGDVGPFAHVAGGCSRCQTEVYGFERAVRLAPYEGLLRDVVLRLKQPGGEGLAELVGELWAEHAANTLQQLQADLLVPVPLHWRRRWWRGFNQCAALAHGLASRLQLPVMGRCLRRTRYTTSQQSLPLTARRDNVRGAFRARPHHLLRGRTVLLIDDVMTTGATASAAARALRDAGAARVIVACLARAQLK